MIQFTNRAISASAGTGKTFRLAHRYLGLMATGVAPDRICALTFSRKAAGEIFDKIVEHLCGAATDAKKRTLTSKTIQAEGLQAPPDKPEAYVQLLRKLLDHQHRLRIGTLDSFILGVVRAFPLELGIPPQTQPINGDGGEALALRQDILVKLFDPSRRSAAGGNPEGDTFLRAFRQACFGQETKALVSVLDNFISEYYGFYRQHSKVAWYWGERDRIWKPSEQWWADPGFSAIPIPGDLLARLTKAFGPGSRPETLARNCASMIEEARAYTADKPWPKFSDTLFSQLILCAMHKAQAGISYYKTEYTLPEDLKLAVRAALGNLINVEVGRALERTQGLRAVLDRYGYLYAEALSRGGSFTFDDLSRLLGEDGLSPSRSPTVPNRLYIDYRLDGKLDHWLLDEFQDTSDTQWDALKNLIDEVIQDENRSFFYVGDVKQTVYGWRGGNYRLFGELLRKYGNAGPRAIVAESIAQCHRSLPKVIEAVNAVFDGLSGWVLESGPDKGPRPDAVAAFSDVWKKHESARQGEGEGFAALLEYGPTKKLKTVDGEDGEEDEGADDPAEFEAVAHVLAQVQPTQQGHTAAVLVRSNAAGRTCVDVLRRRLPAVPVVHEGTGGIVDNPVVTLLLALVRYAAHPGDTVALRHLQMSPLSKYPEIQNFKALPLTILKDLQERGFAGTLREWGARLGELDAFGRQRLRELLSAAEQFDATGVRAPDAFADHIQAYMVMASAAAGTVRVMTIHQAKGLGFDLVIVPFSARAKSFEKPGDPKLLAGADWVLDPPCQQAFKAASGAPLETMDDARADANFAQLCLLYVSLTRAQQALYMIIPEKGKTSATVREADLLRERLAVEGGAGEGPGNLPQLYAAGDPEWYTKPGKSVQPTKSPVPGPISMTYAPEIPRREPSKEHAEVHLFPAGWLFGSEAGDVRAFGSAIHRLFEKIEWFEGMDMDRIIAEWRAESVEPAPFLSDVERQFRACMGNDIVWRQLARPVGAARAEVWREAPFDLVMESDGRKHLMSGRFDRLVVEWDPTGKAVRATVFDFKSNRVESEVELREAAEGYASQMSDYARAAARLLGLPVEQVATLLLFTRTGRIWGNRQQDL